MPAALALSPGNVTVWWMPLPRDPSRFRWRELLWILSREELDRSEHFHTETLRSNYVLSHVLVRTMLSGFANVSPEKWRFQAGPHGKPYVVEPAGLTGIRFNLSHSSTAAACGVADNVELGIDIESISRSVDIDSIAPAILSETELREWKDLPEGSRRPRFFQLWTLKEAHAKACGRGVSCGPAILEDSVAWAVHCELLDGGHQLAVVAERPPGVAVSFAIQRIEIDQLIRATLGGGHDQQ